MEFQKYNGLIVSELSREEKNIFFSISGLLQNKMLISLEQKPIFSKPIELELEEVKRLSNIKTWDFFISSLESLEKNLEKINIRDMDTGDLFTENMFSDFSIYEIDKKIEVNIKDKYRGYMYPTYGVIQLVENNLVD